MDQIAQEYLCSIERILEKFLTLYLADHDVLDGDTVAVPEKTNGVAQKLANKNPYHRGELWLHNWSDVDLHIGLNKKINSDLFATTIAPKDTLIMNANNFSKLYKKEIWGFWDENPQANTFCMVTEFYRT